MNYRSRVAYYFEELLIWIEADVLIRERSQGKLSMISVTGFISQRMAASASYTSWIITAVSAARTRTRHNEVGYTFRVDQVARTAMNTDEELKYTRVEYERRFLVSPHSDWRSAVEVYSKTFEDNYIRGTRLRLRVLTDSDTGRRVIKLTKKFESPSPYFRTISRILLSRPEYELLDGLDGDRLTKVRCYHNYLGRIFSIDVFEGELDGLVLCETEADGLEDLMVAKPPAYAKHEVTEDAFFEGGSLCRVSRDGLMSKLATFE